MQPPANDGIPSPVFTEELVYSDEIHLIAWLDDVDAGRIQFCPPEASTDAADTELLVYNISVVPEYQRRGLAVAMLDEAVRRYPAAGLRLDQGTVSAHGVVRRWLAMHGVSVELPTDRFHSYELIPVIEPPASSVLREKSRGGRRRGRR